MSARVTASLIRRFALEHVEIDDLTISRVKWGRGFAYRDADGRTINDARIRERIVSLAIPPAWREVRIAPRENCHLQAVGRDDEDRLQYLYHPDWAHVRDGVKAERLRRFGLALPALRARLARDLRRRENGLDTVAAAALRIVDKALLRAGHQEYSADDSGRGVATLLKSDVRISGDTIRLCFSGKGGRRIERRITDRPLRNVLVRIRRFPGERLFRYRVDGEVHDLTATGLNAYLKNAAGADVSVKDFRTFAASARALHLLALAGCPESERARVRLVASTAKAVSEELQNTPQIARTSYIHPAIVDGAGNGFDQSLLCGPCRAWLSRGETALMRFLESSGRP